DFQTLPSCERTRASAVRRWHSPCTSADAEAMMTSQRSCIYCRNAFQAAALTAEPVLPAALGGRLALKRAVCPDCAPRVRALTDAFLATRFALTAGAMAARRRAGPKGARPGHRSLGPPARRPRARVRRGREDPLLLSAARARPAGSLERAVRDAAPASDGRPTDAPAAGLGDHAAGSLPLAPLARADVRLGALGGGGR